jgi:hypothetical protein
MNCDDNLKEGRRLRRQNRQQRVLLDSAVTCPHNVTTAGDPVRAKTVTREENRLRQSEAWKRAKQSATYCICQGNAWHSEYNHPPTLNASGQVLTN